MWKHTVQKPRCAAVCRLPDMVNGMEVIETDSTPEQCDVCIQAKMTCAPIRNQSSMVYENTRDLVVSDVWGPTQVEGPHGKQWFVLFTDVVKRKSFIFFARHKSKAPDKVKLMNAYYWTQLGTSIKVLRVDNGRKYVNGPLRSYLVAEGIKLKTTAPYSPHQNGIVEWLNWVLVERACAMLLVHKLLGFLWVKAVAYVCYLKNCSPTHALGNITPEEMFMGKCPNITEICEFGVPVWVMTVTIHVQS
jgi:hypothetical protein